MDTTAPARLADRIPEVDAGRMAASLVPPRQFTRAGLDNYRPDPDYPSQQAAVDAVGAFTADWTSPPGGLFRRGPKPPERPGLYLDGGFGVGKTHLLAALWRLAPGRKYFGTFIEYTALVGALGYAEAVRLLTGSTLLAIDEFELDDPGDTMLMSRLLGELVATGTRIGATSNTPPNALGEGRFAASDFLREIQGLSDRFTTVRNRSASPWISRRKSAAAKRPSPSAFGGVFEVAAMRDPPAVSSPRNRDMSIVSPGSSSSNSSIATMLAPFSSRTASA